MQGHEPLPEKVELAHLMQVLLKKPYPIWHPEVRKHVEPSVEHFPVAQLGIVQGHESLPEKVEFTHLMQLLLVRPYPVVHDVHSLDPPP